MSRGVALLLALAVLAVVLTGCQEEPPRKAATFGPNDPGAQAAHAYASNGGYVESIVRSHLERTGRGEIDSISCERELARVHVHCSVTLVPKPGDRCEHRIDISVKGERVVRDTTPLICISRRR